MLIVSELYRGKQILILLHLGDRNKCVYQALNFTISFMGKCSLYFALRLREREREGGGRERVLSLIILFSVNSQVHRCIRTGTPTRQKYILAMHVHVLLVFSTDTIF